MKLWRISSYVDLSGEGGRYVSGRWHLQGPRIVYAAETAALAMIEYLVNVGDRSRIPENACLFSISIPSVVSRSEIDIARLPQDWKNQELVTQQIGSAWLDRCSTALLKVPAATAPEASNYLINPKHADCGLCTIVDRYMSPFDQRLLTLK